MMRWLRRRLLPSGGEEFERLLAAAAQLEKDPQSRAELEQARDLIRNARTRGSRQERDTITAVLARAELDLGIQLHDQFDLSKEILRAVQDNQASVKITEAAAVELRSMFSSVAEIVSGHEQMIAELQRGHTQIAQLMTAQQDLALRMGAHAQRLDIKRVRIEQLEAQAREHAIEIADLRRQLAARPAPAKAHATYEYTRRIMEHLGLDTEIEREAAE